MADILLLLGAALCAISIPAALIALLRTEAPRAAAILLVGGVLALALAAWINRAASASASLAPPGAGFFPDPACLSAACPV